MRWWSSSAGFVSDQTLCNYSCCLTEDDLLVVCQWWWKLSNQLQQSSYRVAPQTGLPDISIYTGTSGQHEYALNRIRLLNRACRKPNLRIVWTLEGAERNVLVNTLGHSRQALNSHISQHAPLSQHSPLSFRKQLCSFYFRGKLTCWNPFTLPYTVEIVLNNNSHKYAILPINKQFNYNVWVCVCLCLCGVGV